MLDLADVLGDYINFLEVILRRVEEAGFEMADFVQLDHLCYRTVSQQNYEVKKHQLQALAKQIGETKVNGRMIAVFRLHQPIRFKGWRIDVVEVPAPKPMVDYDEGLEHIEFVLFDEKTDFLLKYRDKTFILKSSERGINPEIGYRLGEYGVKFHLLNLATVVYLEKKFGITDISC